MPNGSSLPHFVHNWIGGDIHGLLDLAQKLGAYPSRVQELAAKLSATTSQLTAAGPGSWQGSASDAFLTELKTQLQTARALEEYVAGVAQAIGSLAVELAQIENALESQAYQLSHQGVMIGPDGSVERYDGPHGLELAMEYNRAREEALAVADQARSAAAQQLYGLYQQVFNPNPHPSTADAVTGAGLLADLLASPTASRRDVSAKLKVLKGKSLKLREEIAEARRAGRTVPRGTEDEAVKIDKELQEVEDELKSTGKTESALSKLLDTRASDAENYVQGKAGSGRHVAGNTPDDLKAAAEEPKFLKQILKTGNNIPLIDVGTTLVGTAVGTYYDVKGGESLGSAVRDEAISNTAGTVAGMAATTGLAGAEWGGELGAAAGPVGVAAGVVVGYGVGDIAHNMCTEKWGQDTLHHGEAIGLAVGTWHSVVATGKDVGQLGVGVGHEAEHLWDNVFD